MVNRNSPNWVLEEKLITDKISYYSQELAKYPQMFQEREISKLPPNPEKMKAAIGIVNLEIALMVEGKSDGAIRELSKEDFEQIVMRMREMIDDGNWADIEDG